MANDFDKLRADVIAALIDPAASPAKPALAEVQSRMAPAYGELAARVMEEVENQTNPVPLIEAIVMCATGPLVNVFNALGDQSTHARQLAAGYFLAAIRPDAEYDHSVVDIEQKAN